MKTLSLRLRGALHPPPLLSAGCSLRSETPPGSSPVYRLQEEFVDAGGVLIYTRTLGPGSRSWSFTEGRRLHDYFLPYLCPGRTIASSSSMSGIGALGEAGGSGGLHRRAMVETWRRCAPPWDSAGSTSWPFLRRRPGQAYALKYQKNLDHLVLCSTFHSTRKMNEVFRRMKEKMAPDLRDRIAKMEARASTGTERCTSGTATPTST